MRVCFYQVATMHVSRFGDAHLSPSNMMRPFALALASTSGMSKGIARYCRMAPAVADSGVYGLLPFGTPFAAGDTPTS